MNLQSMICFFACAIILSDFYLFILFFSCGFVSFEKMDSAEQAISDVNIVLIFKFKLNLIS